MNKNKLAIATMTWARDNDEEKLLRESLAGLAELKLPTFITDGGSKNDFLDYVKSFPNFTLLQPAAKGVWPQVQTSLKAACDSEADFIIYTEPDKMDFFRTGLPDLLEKTSLTSKTGMTIAVRSEAGFKSYPSFQQMCETTINNCCSEVTQINSDYTYGPFIMNKVLVGYLDNLKPAIGWGWRPYVFVVASRLGYQVEGFEGAYFCPPDQQLDNANERIYRMRQLSENIEAIVLASKATL